MTPTVFPSPRRMANGISFNRLLLVTAVLTKRAHLALGTQDIAINVAGGLRVEEPAADLAAVLAITSSAREVPLPPSLVALGEVGLAGEVRRVPQIQRRLAEASRLGFQQALVPASQVEEIQGIAELEVLAASDVREALHRALGPVQRRRSPRPSDKEQELAPLQQEPLSS